MPAACSESAPGPFAATGRELGSSWMVIGLATLALLLECAVFAWLLSGKLSGLAAALVHGLISAALAVWVWKSPRVREDVRLPLLLAVSTAALGPVGPAGTLLTVALTKWYACTATPFEEWYESLFPELKPEGLSHLFDRISAENEPALGHQDLTPFTDVLTFGTLEQRRAVIALMGRHFQPAFGPHLRRALSDRSNAVRVQAASVLNRIEDNFLETYVELSIQAAAEPPEAEALLALASHLDQHCEKGLLDTARERESRDEAIAIYRRYLELRPRDPESQVALGRLLLRDGKFAEAAAHLNGFADTVQSKLWYMECLFRLNRCSELREHARALASGDFAELPSDVHAAVKLWAQS